jgi:hypothetical protein
MHIELMTNIYVGPIIKFWLLNRVIQYWFKYNTVQ